MIYFTFADYLDKGEFPSSPFVFAYIMYDIPQTVCAAMDSLPDNCVGVFLGRHGTRHLPKIEETAKRNGLHIFWYECEKAMIECQHQQ